MATITLTITVEDIAATIVLFDEIKVYRSTAGAGGPFVELTTIGTRIPLVAGQSVYTFVDTAGDPAFFYKTSFFNSTSTSESSLSDAVQGSVDPLIISVDDLRDEGLVIPPGGPEEDRALMLIKTFQDYIEGLTGTWFVPRQVSLDLDGRGTKVLQVAQPMISVTNLFINDDFVNVVPTTSYVAYTRRGAPDGRDDRKNPRVKLITDDVSIFEGTGALRRSTAIFEVGEQNQRIEGTFGFVDADGCAPRPIQYALKKLVVARFPKLATTSTGGGSSGPAGPKVEEETDRHRVEWGDPTSAVKFHGRTGDFEVDMILATYKRPLVVRGPRTLGRRLRARGSFG